MWKRKKKQKEAKAAAETVEAVTEDPRSSAGEQAVSVETEKASSAKEEEKASTPAEAEQAVSTTAEEVLPVKEKKREKKKVSVGTGEAVPVKKVSSSGVFIFGNKIESRFKRFMTAMFSIFLLPPAIVFGLAVITAAVLIAFPLISIVLPITLLSLCMLFILLPVVIPFLTVVSLITGKGKIQFGLENKKFAIKVLGITMPPYAGR